MSVDALTGTGTEFRPAGALLDTDEALAPYKGPWSPRLAAHLLRRAGFGGSPSEIADSAKAGMSASVGRLTNFASDSLPSQPQGDISYQFGPNADKKQRQRSYLLTSVWYLNRVLQTSNPLQEKMVYFWHNHFTSSIGQGGITPQMMVNQINLFRSFALGDYARLTHEVSRDSAMLLYLNNNQNRAQHPNENYARELMELFSMGVGNYTEADIRESARAFTGWVVNRRFGETAMFVPRLHDFGSKTFLGRTGNFTGDDIVDIIMEQPATARYMARKFARAFIYDNPEPALVDALAARFRSSRYDVGALMNTILRSNIFYSDRAYRAIVKSPLDVVIGAHKALGATSVEPNALFALDRMGQTPLRPPNVAGWPGGALWVNTGTLLARVNYLTQLALAKSANGAAGADAAMMDDITSPQALRAPASVADPMQWVAGVNMADPAGLTERVLWMTVQGDATPQQRDTILTYLQTDSVGNKVALSMENFEEKVRGAMSLAFALPAYQLL
jgi:uncharacterized protein (DUF1800 family)